MILLLSRKDYWLKIINYNLCYKFVNAWYIAFCESVCLFVLLSLCLLSFCLCVSLSWFLCICVTVLLNICLFFGLSLCRSFMYSLSLFTSYHDIFTIYNLWKSKIYEWRNEFITWSSCASLNQLHVNCMLHVNVFTQLYHLCECAMNSDAPGTWLNKKYM